MSGALEIRKTTKISIISILSFLLFADLVTIEYFASSVYTLIQYVILLPIIMYCFSNYIYIFKSNRKIIFCMLIIVICILTSSYINDISRDSFRSAIFYGVLLLTLFLFISIIAYKNKMEYLLHAGKMYLLFVLAINDALMFLLPNQFYNISGREIGTCFLGNKFNVAYAHLMLFFLVLILEKNDSKKRKKAIIYAIVFSFICVYVDCTTVLLVVWLLLIMHFLPVFIRKILANPIVFSVFFYLAAFLLIVWNEILSFGPLKYFIVNILHRDLTLTGRLEVYPYIFQVFESHKWFGYGYETNIIEKTSIWYANAQNAFWDFVIRYGLITMFFLFILLLMVVFRYSKICNTNTDTLIWTSFSILYVYIFMGIGEIIYSKYFFFYIALLSALCMNDKLQLVGKVDKNDAG